MFCCKIEKKETLVTKLILTRDILRQIFLRKTFMLDNIRMVGNIHNTNYVAQFLLYWDILLESKVFYVSL